MVSGGIYVPFPKPDLVGRESAIEGLHHALGFDQPVALMPALTGQGGVGKTQLAILYAYEKASYYPGGVFWLNASGLTADPATSQDPKTIVRQLADYATQLGLKTDVSAQDDADRQRALRWLGEVRQRKDVLLIVDNVDDTGLLIRDLPSLPNNRLIGLGCRIIVTSRHRDLPGCKSMQVELLARPHDRELLLREALRSPRSAGDQ